MDVSGELTGKIIIDTIQMANASRDRIRNAGKFGIDFNKGILRIALERGKRVTDGGDFGGNGRSRTADRIEQIGLKFFRGAVNHIPTRSCGTSMKPAGIRLACQKNTITIMSRVILDVNNIIRHKNIGSA